MDEMEAANAWDFETNYKQILFKLNLEDLDKQVKFLSGGQRKRLALARMLLKKPDFIIMDEPTNHLDLDMIEWLEEYFRKEDFTIFMVTHDRYFLERVCNEIVELEAGALHTYKGNYSYYLQKRDERHQLEQTNTEKAQQLYKKSWTGCGGNQRPELQSPNLELMIFTTSKIELLKDARNIRFN